MDTLALILAPALVVVLATTALLHSRMGRETAVAGGPPPEPIWTSPVGFTVIAALVLLVAAFVVPRLLGLTFLVLPFLWSRGPGRRRRDGGGGPGPFGG